MSHRLSATELELLKELAAAGRRGRTVPTTSHTGLDRTVEMHYVTAFFEIYGASKYDVHPLFDAALGK
jgi:hypothetical protein